MNDMNRKKLYVWQLAAFLNGNSMVMSGEELAAHLNRNNFRTGYGTQYEGARGTFKLIAETWSRVNRDLGLEDEAKKIALAYVKPDGTHAWDKE